MMNKELLEFLSEPDNRQFKEYVTSNLFAVAEKYAKSLFNSAPCPTYIDCIAALLSSGWQFFGI